MKVALDMAANAYQRDGKLSGIATGLRDLDVKMGGLQRSDLIIVAGRPGMGKTALATNIAYNIARAHEEDVQVDGTKKSINGGIVGFFSCEMSAEQLATRILAEQTRIASSMIRRGGIKQDEFDRIRDYTIELEHLPLFVDETGGLSISQLTARARRLKRQKGLDVIVVDYIQLLQGSGKRGNENRVQEVTEITTSLKALAKELNVPVIALSQLSRQVENRDDKHPQLSDLRESGSIEQDADVVLFVYREEYYLQNKEPKPGTPEHEKWQLEMELALGKAEVIIAKQRHGPTGTVKLQFEGNTPASATSWKRTICPTGRRSPLSARLNGGGRTRKIRHEHRFRPKVASGRFHPFAGSQQGGGAGCRQWHSDGRSRRAGRQLAQAREDCGSRRMLRRHQGQRLWLRHRTGRASARQGRLQDLLRRYPR